MICVTRKIFTKSYLKSISKNLNNSSIRLSESIRKSYHQDLNTLEDKILISDACIERMKKVTKEEFLRVSVEGGGCSGFSYKFELDKITNEDDRIFERSGVKVVTDVDSLELIKGSTIDYEVELIKSAFRIKDNPQSQTSCSCGVSFSI